jgi:hypothetical protein
MIRPAPGRLRAACGAWLLGLCGAATFAPSPARALSQTDALQTTAERSGFERTGRYDEVQRLCAEFERRHPRDVRCTTFGRTPQGRPMLALVASRSGALTPAEARRRGLPVLLVQGGIHAGEIEGKDAGFISLRDALRGRGPAADALARQVLVFVPVFNVDGHERFGAWNRPNQAGPKEMGWRTTAQNLNLNRDYAKADAPEMRAMLALVEAWDPLAVIDLHTTDGAKFEHDVSIQVDPLNAGDEALRGAGRTLRDAVIAELARQGSLPLPFYMAFRTDDDPASGFEDGVMPPRFSTGYFWLRNRFAMLVETHSWKDYATRVAVTRRTIDAVLQQVAAHGREWTALVHAADARAAALAGQPVPMTWEASDSTRTVPFRGYAYTRTPSDVSGQPMTRYDDQRPQTFQLPLRDDLRPALVVNAPGAGYLVPAEQAALVAPRLQSHGLRFSRLAVAWPQAPVHTFRAELATLDAKSTEGHQRLAVQGRWAAERRDLAAGALFVPIAQPRARLVMALLEPLAPDSLLAWGFFNNAFEPKEYMEDYVAEDVAREQLARDPALAEAFRQRLAQDPAFAGNPKARLEFFYKRHPSYDERLNLYPVLRSDTLPPDVQAQATKR